MHIITVDSDEKAVLYKKAQSVPLPISLSTIEKIEEMRAFYKTFDDKSGFAAPQVGLLERIILVENDLYDGNESNEPVILINPIWEPINDEQGLSIEGCLSVPGKTGIVSRHLNIKLTAHRYDLKTQTTHLIEKTYHHEFSCILWQHELDHLDGKIYTDKALALLEKPEANLIIQFLYETKQITESTSIFDLAPRVLDIAKAYQQQGNALHAFLLEKLKQTT